MKIYKAEIDAGLQSKMTDNKSLSYVSKINPNAESLGDFKITFAETKPVFSADLYTTISLLVSSVWNKNDDVFTKEEIWEARSTPTHHPTNLEHDQSQIIGHMTEVWATDDDNNLIPDDTAVENLPEILNLVNSSVIYTQWSQEDLLLKVNELIEKIEAGDKFVSMECTFEDFDFAIRSPDGKETVVARDENSAFLTRHLRCFGGVGKYDDYRIGRKLKGITFVGKGFVDNPANERSIIFSNEDTKFTASASKRAVFDENGVLSIVESNFKLENKSMSNENKDQTIEGLKAEISQLQAQLSEKNVATMQEKVEDLENRLEASEAKNSELTEQLKIADEVKAEVEDLKTSLATVSKEYLEFSRVAQLVNAGVPEDQIDDLVEKFRDLNRDQWEAVLATIVLSFKMNTPNSFDNERVATNFKGQSMIDRYNAKFRLSRASVDENEDDADADLPENTTVASDVNNENQDDEPQETELEVVQRAMASLIGVKIEQENK